MTTPTETTKDPVPQKKRGAEAPSGQAWQSAGAVQDLRNAFILGWSLVELRSRVQMAALDDKKLPSTAKGSDGNGGPDPVNPVQLVKGMNDRLLRASRMRTGFNSIVVLQRAKFPSSVTVDTLYDPPDEKELPYLYPPAPDYANIGINPLGIEEDGRPVWADFRLFDATRRAINCLTLLLVTPEDSLVPTMVASQQARLSDQILEAAEKESRRASKDTDEAAAMTHSLATTAVRSWEHYDAETSAASTQENIPLAPRTEYGKAITTLSFLTVRLLQAWDGYLRERITAEGFGANNLITLLAYEAGRNMATISWNTSVNAILLENQAAQDEEARKNLRE
jgi:hypothetical protein